MNGLAHPLYEDNHLLIVHKPVGMPVQADASGDPDLLTLLKEDIKIRYNKPGGVYLGLVHRLDRPTGGVMVFARTSKAASRLSDLFRRRLVEKSYLAIATGSLPEREGRLEDRLDKDGKSNTVTIVREGGRPASLRYRLETVDSSGLRLYAVVLETGRGHQIRVQFAGAGAPLWGDHRYGDREWKPGQDLALWSHGIAFDHPVGGRRMEFRAEPPAGYPWSLFPQLRS